MDGGVWGSAGRRQGESGHPTARTTEGSAHVSRTSSIPQGVRARLPPTALYPAHFLPFPAEGTVQRATKSEEGPGEEGRGPQRAREPGERRPRPTPGAGWREAGHAHAVAGSRALGGGGARVQFSAGAGGCCGEQGCRGRGAGRGSWERAARGRVRVCEAAVADPRAQSAESRGCEPRGTAALLCRVNSSGVDLSEGRAGRRLLPAPRGS